MTQVHTRLRDHLTADRLLPVKMWKSLGNATPTYWRVVWELGHAPNLRIKIVCGHRRYGRFSSGVYGALSLPTYSCSGR